MEEVDRLFHIIQQLYQDTSIPSIISQDNLKDTISRYESKMKEQEEERETEKKKTNKKSRKGSFNWRV